MQKRKYSTETNEPPVLMHATPMLYAFSQRPIWLEEDTLELTQYDSQGSNIDKTFTSIVLDKDRLELTQHEYQNNSIDKKFAPKKLKEDTLEITLELIQYEYQGSSSIKENFFSYAKSAIHKMDEYNYEHLKGTDKNKEINKKIKLWNKKNKPCQNYFKLLEGMDKLCLDELLSIQMRIILIIEGCMIYDIQSDSDDSHLDDLLKIVDSLNEDDLKLTLTKMTELLDVKSFTSKHYIRPSL